MYKKIETIDEYIQGFPSEVQLRLKLIRQIIKDNAPEVIESIAYGMPAYKYNKNPLVDLLNILAFMQRQQDMKNLGKRFLYINKEKVLFNFRLTNYYQFI